MRQSLLPALALVLLGCDASMGEPLCTRSAFSSRIEIRVVGFGASYGDIDNAHLDFCIPDVTCASAGISAVPGGFECRANASLDAPEQWCQLQLNGTLVILMELKGSLAELSGEHLLTLDLAGADIEPIEGTAPVLLLPVEGNGEGCGYSHVFGSLTVDALLREPTAG
jgi:hypothetical protein